MSESPSRDEPCGCKSFLIDKGSDLWVMEASCPEHRVIIEKFDHDMRHHIEEYHRD